MATFAVPRSNSASRSTQLSLLGAASAIGLAVILLILTLFGGVSYTHVISQALDFLTGNLSAVSQETNQGLLTASLNIVAVVLMTLAAAAVIGMLCCRGVEWKDKFAIDELLKKGPLALFSVVVVEELFARGLFLGVLPHFLHGTVAFYALFLIGNSLWALAHIPNFKPESVHGVLPILPQFVGGIGYTLVFIKYGLPAAIAAHMLYNLVVLAARKKTLPSKTDLKLAAFYGLLLVVLIFVMSLRGIGLDALQPWLDGAVARLEHFSFLDYALVLVTVDCCAYVVAEVLLLDRSEYDETTIKNVADHPGSSVLFGAVFIAGLFLLGNWLLSHFVNDITTRSIILTVIVCLLLNNARTGSAFARAILVYAPATFVSICAISVLGLWQAIGLCIIFSIVSLPQLLLLSRKE